MTITLTDTATRSARVIQEVERAIVGKRPLLEKMMAAVLAGGHILLEDYPGLAKTLVAKSFAVALGLDFKRIQFTPDLLPGDITGSYIYDRAQNRFELRRGPIFANIILADEINRASPKTQSALLEAMQEYQVTLEGDTMPLPDPFIVIATQNPIEYEGTFPLPEAQLDRFLLKLSIGYPAPAEEQEILRRRRERHTDAIDLAQITDAVELLAMRKTIEEIFVHADLEKYIVDLVNLTRKDKRVAVGASPRGSLALLKLARAQAALSGRAYVLPDDVKQFALPGLIHRLILEPGLWMKTHAADAQEFVYKLHDALVGGAPPVSAWLDKRNLRPSLEWDEQLAEAIRACRSLLFVLSRDSVEPQSVCKLEWRRALKYKKPIVPLLFHHDAELPFLLEGRQYIDFTGSFDTGLARLRHHLTWLDTPEGALQTLRDRLADARRAQRRAADSAEQTRIETEIEALTRQVAEQEQLVADPQAAARRVEQSIQAGLERERRPERPLAGAVRTKFINPPPVIAPPYFQDRHVETQLIANFLRQDSQRLLTVVGRGGIGKSALVCRLLKALENGRLPDDLGDLPLDGLVYLSAIGSRRVNLPNLYADLCQLLPPAAAAHLDALYKNPQAGLAAKMEALLAAFPPAGRVVVLLDNFEDVVAADSQAVADAELAEALCTALARPPHPVKFILTTRLAPRDLALRCPERQVRLNLDEGLESPHAENILRQMDADGKVGLRAAPDDLLAQARERTRGYPRALEALFAILAADRHTDLAELLAAPLPANVTEALVGEAFNRLEPADQQVLQALAIYGRPVTPTAVDYLLQPDRPGLDSAPRLNRLVNMQIARKETGRYYLHPVDSAYALSRLPAALTPPAPPVFDLPSPAIPPPAPDYRLPSTAYLYRRAADYFRQTRHPRADWRSLADLAPQLAEFDLRCAAGDYDTAARVLLEIDFNYLDLWGHYRLMIDLHERLQGKLRDAENQQLSVGKLGLAYYSTSQYLKAITCYDQALALALEQHNRWAEGAWLGNLGNCYAPLGQTARAIDYYEQVLPIAREIGHRQGESAGLGSLGNCYFDLGQTVQAIDYYEQGLAIAREIGDRKGEGISLGNLAEALINTDRYDEARQVAQEYVNICAEINKPASYAYGWLALAHLYAGDLAAARVAAEAARQYDEPRNNHAILALLGLIALRQGQPEAAQEACAATLAQVEQLLAYTPQNYNALDSQALALAVLRAAGGGAAAPTPAAILAAYRAARAINQDAGVVGRVKRLFRALAVADTAGLLAEVLAEIEEGTRHSEERSDEESPQPGVKK